jgi:hypothetical protein
MSLATSSAAYAILDPILPNLNPGDIKSCNQVNRSWNRAISRYLKQHGICSQDQLIEKVREFIRRKLDDPKKNKWAASWACYFPFNPDYACRIIVGNHDDLCAKNFSKEELDYVSEVKKGSRSPDPDKKENWPLPYEEEVCLFSARLPKKPLPPCNDYVKFTPYAQTYNLVFDKAMHGVAKYLIVAITFPGEMDGFTRRIPHSETLRSDFIYTLQSIMQATVPSHTRRETCL